MADRARLSAMQTPLSQQQPKNQQQLLPASLDGDSTATVGIALDAVLKPSVAMPESALQVKGYDFNRGIDYPSLISHMLTSGFQATAYDHASLCIALFVRLLICMK
jgi:hypothetical protein